MKKITKMFVALALCVFGVSSVLAEPNRLYADFSSPSTTPNITWEPSTDEGVKGVFSWNATSWNQLRNLQLPAAADGGDLTKYKKLVLDCEITQGTQFRVLFYQGSANKTLYAKDGLNEWIIYDELSQMGDDWKGYMQNCTEICLSGDNGTAPGQAIIKAFYLEEYDEGEVIPDITPEEEEVDPGRPAGEFVDLDASFFNVEGLTYVVGEKKAKGDFILGDMNKDHFADLTGYSKLTVVATPGLPLTLTFNHEVDEKDTKDGYAEEDADKYVWIDGAAGEDGIYELDLTDINPLNLNYIRIPWGFDKMGTVWYLLLTESTDPLAIVKKALSNKIDEAKMQSAFGKTTDSFATLTNAISDAEGILSNAGATESDINNAIESLDYAIAGLELATGYTNLTQAMFLTYNSTDADAYVTEPAWAALQIGEATGMPYGDGNVGELNWADLAAYDKLIVVAANDIKPRFCMNRLVNGGQQAATMEESNMIDINPNNDFTWSTDKYLTVEDNVYTVDLKAIVDDYGFARLHSIKKQGWGADIIVSDMLLYADNVELTVGDAGYASFSSAFDVNLDGVTGYAAVYDGEKVVLTEVYSVPAGEGAIVKADAGTYEFTITENVAPIDGNWLQVSNGTVQGDGTIYVLANGIYGPGFYLITYGENVPAGKVYIQIENTSRSFIAIGSEATGIKTVETAKGDNSIYNLNGQRISKAQKGVNIMNGKKAIVK